MGEEDKGRVWERLNTIINALIFLVLLTTLILTLIRVFPLLSEKLEAQVTQVAGRSVETLRVSRGQTEDGKESVILSIPFAIRVVNIGKTDAFLRQCLTRPSIEVDLPKNCSYRPGEISPQEYFKSPVDSAPVKFPIHLGSGEDLSLHTWLKVAIIGEPARILLKEDPPIIPPGDEVANHPPGDLRSALMGTSLGLCNVGMEVRVTATTSEQNTFSGAVIEWKPPFVPATVVDPSAGE